MKSFISGFFKMLLLIVFVLIGVGYCVSNIENTTIQNNTSQTTNDVDYKKFLMCKQYVKLNANHPSTVDFDWGYDTIHHPNGRTSIIVGYSAKNGFGAEFHLQTRCLFEKNGDFIEGVTVEK